MTKPSPDATGHENAFSVRLSARDRALLAASVLGGLTFTAMCSLFAWHLGVTAAREQFLNDADKLREKVNQRVTMVELFVDSLQSLLHASTDVDADQFRVFAEGAMAQHRFLTAATYAPAVDDADLADFVKEKALEGFLGFRVFDLAAGQDRTTAAARARHFPVVLRYPSTPDNVGLVGMDLMGSPGFVPVIAHAIATGEPSVTAPFTHDGHAIVEVLAPIYQGKGIPRNVGLRYAKINGLVTATLLPERLLVGMDVGEGATVTLEAKVPGQGAARMAHASTPPSSPWPFPILRNEGEWDVGHHEMAFRLTVVREGWPSAHDLAITLAAFALGIIVTGFCYKLTRTAIDRAHYARQLGARNAELRHLSGNLQKLVEARTSELAAAFAQVSAEKSRIQEISHELAASYQELQKAQEQLVSTAHKAGMAEVITGILHNVGNILNSISVSNAEMRRLLRASRVASLTDAADLLERHRGDWPGFFARDPKGLALPQFYVTMARALDTDFRNLEEESERLTKCVSLANEVIRAQQTYAKVDTYVQRKALETLVDDALRIQGPALASLGVAVHKEYRARGDVAVPHNKLMNVLINVLANAADALGQVPPHARSLTIAIDRDGDALAVTVSDSGVGIAPDVLAQIFRHGFTTKPDGHGFGLTSSAGLMGEMGGSLSVTSAGVGQGASARVILPAAAGKGARAGGGAAALVG